MRTPDPTSPDFPRALRAVAAQALIDIATQTDSPETARRACVNLIELADAAPSPAPVDDPRAQAAARAALEAHGAAALDATLPSPSGRGARGEGSTTSSTPLPPPSPLGGEGQREAVRRGSPEHADDHAVVRIAQASRATRPAEGAGPIDAINEEDQRFTPPAHPSGGEGRERGPDIPARPAGAPQSPSPGGAGARGEGYPSSNARSRQRRKPEDKPTARAQAEVSRDETAPDKDHHP